MTEKSLMEQVKANDHRNTGMDTISWNKQYGKKTIDKQMATNKLQ